MSMRGKKRHGLFTVAEIKTKKGKTQFKAWVEKEPELAVIVENPKQALKLVKELWADICEARERYG